MQRSFNKLPGNTTTNIILSEGLGNDLNAQACDCMPTLEFVLQNCSCSLVLNSSPTLQVRLLSADYGTDNGPSTV